MDTLLRAPGAAPGPGSRLPGPVRAALAAVAGLVAVGCGGDDPLSAGSIGDDCARLGDEIQDGGPGKDGIPALTNPTLVFAGDPGANYVAPEDRVIGLHAGGEAVAVPLEIGWWHEIVNLEVGGELLAVTHCPLTGSSMVFDRVPLEGAAFGVSGLLFRNNLVMYDRRTNESLWPQMLRQAVCGDAERTLLQMYPAVETTWASWLAAHPDTRVVSDQTGFRRAYNVYPYGSYRDIDNPDLLFPLAIDTRRPPKELSLVIPAGEGGVAYPFGELAELGSVGVTRLQVVPNGVLFWDGPSRTAAAYFAEWAGTPLTFMVVDGAIRDVETGSSWSVNGVAESGPLVGAQLEGVADAYVAYWFAWAAFAPNTEIWRAS